MHDPFLVFKLPVAIVKCKLQLQRYYIHKQELSFIMTTHFMIPVVHDNILGINQNSGMLQFVWLDIIDCKNLRNDPITRKCILQQNCKTY